MIMLEHLRRAGVGIIKAALIAWLVIWGGSFGLLTPIPFLAVYLGAGLALEGNLALSFCFIMIGGFLSAWTLCLLSAALDFKPTNNCKLCRFCLWLFDVVDGGVR